MDQKIPRWIAKVKTVVFLMKTHGEISAFKLDYAPNDYAGGKEKYRYKEANAREGWFLFTWYKKSLAISK